MSITGNAKWPLPNAWRELARRSKGEQECLEARLLFRGVFRFAESNPNIIELGARGS
jgi:hypothetical protein